MSASNQDNGGGISHQAIIVICLCGAGVSLLCAWAVGRHFSQQAPAPPPTGDVVGGDGTTQTQYMRLVRLRNQEMLQHDYGYARPKPVTYSSYVSEV